MRIKFTTLIFVLFAAVLPGLASAEEPQSLPVSPLEITTATGTYSFEVEVALSFDEKRTGLMFRHEMADNHGMLFYYPFPEKIGMWMKNTYIPLDMLFIFPDGTISGIATNTKPLSLKTITSKNYVNAVLELNAGTVEKLGIKEGDVVHHDFFNNLQRRSDEQ